MGGGRVDLMVSVLVDLSPLLRLHFFPHTHLQPTTRRRRRMGEEGEERRGKREREGRGEEEEQEGVCGKERAPSPGQARGRTGGGRAGGK
jgi:hypothetical protein